MDGIYKGILLSDHNNLMKRTLIEKFVLSASEGDDLQNNVIDRILSIALETAAISPDHHNRINFGCVVFETYARRHVTRARALLTEEVLRHYLSEEISADVAAVLRLVAFVFALTVESSTSECSSSSSSNSSNLNNNNGNGNDDVVDDFGARQVTVVLEEAPRLLDRDDNLNVAAPLVELMLRLDRGLLSAFDRAAFVRKLVRCMARCQLTDKSQLLTLIKNAEVVAAFMRTLLILGDREAVEHCFSEMFVVLSSPANGTEPCACMASILSVFPVSVLEAASKSAVLEVRCDDRILETILRRLLEWLVWPGAKNLDLVIIHYMSTLESLNRQLLLIKVTQQVAGKLFMFLRSTMWCEFVLPVLLKMLLSYLHSSDVFHGILPCVPNVLESLLSPQSDVDGKVNESSIGTDREKSEASSAGVADQVIALVYTLMEFFPGFPEIYDPILTELQDYPKPDPLKMLAMRDFAMKNKWTCEARSLIASAASSFALQMKSSTGKVGLFNLGQSCYANSILQALYMNDEFRNKILLVMSRLPAPIFDLQNVFAFLTHSQRAAYSPEAFLRVSRPPWFHEGNQQDCSEYLRYFLDQLHEQGKWANSIEQHKEAKWSSPSGNVDVCPTTTMSTNTVCEFHSGSTTLGNDESGSKMAKKLCLIHDLFGGHLLISYQCFGCLQMSRQIETFIDLSLALQTPATSVREAIDCDVHEAVKHEQQPQQSLMMEASSSSTSSSPSTSTSSASTLPPEASESLKLDDLLQFYLTPEKLEGENSYHCVNCGQLQEAQKTTRITKAPKYLILTLLRFSYDSKTHQRTKILRNVDYPEVLRLPIYTGSTGDHDGGDIHQMSTETYSLYAVVMHSGTSSDCGHYYTYACHSRTLPELFSHDKDVVKNVEERSWYLFNDSRVTYSQYKAFCNGGRGTNVGQKKQQQHFGRDTAYLLFYRKITTAEVESASEHDPKGLSLHGDLYEAVRKDNQSFLREMEDEAVREEQRKKSAQRDSVWRDFDDRNPPGSCGGGGGNGGFARFVC